MKKQKPKTKFQEYIWDPFIWPTIAFLLVFTLLFGIIYPCLVTLILQFTFHEKANGSLFYHEKIIRGSKLIGQSFSDPKFFWGRPSAVSSPYQVFSSGSNLNPSNPLLYNHVKSSLSELTRIDPQNDLPIPIDLVTSSASGLDPHISIAAAEYQAARVARARGLDLEIINKLITSMTEKRTFGVLGEPRINVLEINAILDNMNQ